MTAQELYMALKQQLHAAGLPAAVEYRVLFEVAAGRPYMEFTPEASLPEHVSAKAMELAQRRISGYPLQYIAGRWPFLDFELEVGEGVLIPRPETEQVALRAIALIAGRENPRVLDLCSGSGCLAVAVARAFPNAAVTAVEYMPQAFAYLKRNAAALAPHIKAVLADATAFMSDCSDNIWDMILSNPPYVRPDEYADNLQELQFEPKQAFLGGEDGLDFYRWFISGYKYKLKPGGVMLFETGFNQTEHVARLFAESGYNNITTETDDFGLPRMVYAIR